MFSPKRRCKPCSSICTASALCVKGGPAKMDLGAPFAFPKKGYPNQNSSRRDSQSLRFHWIYSHSVGSTACARPRLQNAKSRAGVINPWVKPTGLINMGSTLPQPACRLTRGAPASCDGRRRRRRARLISTEPQTWLRLGPKNLNAVVLYVETTCSVLWG